MKKASILIVEDNNIVMLELKDRLGDMGYEVVDSAISGNEAIKKAKEHNPGLIIMDIRLKGDMDGIDTAARIKKELDIPFIYLTAHSDDDTLERAKMTEPYGYIIKPFEERELFSTIEMALYKYEMEKKLKESRHWLSTTLRSIGDALIATDSAGTIKIFNHVAEHITGWKTDEAFGIDIKKVFKIKDNDDPVLISLRYHSIVGATNKILIGKNGKETPVDFSSAPIKEENGLFGGIVLVFRDITERIKAKELIEKQRIFLRQIIDTDPNYISVKNADGKYELSNKAAAEALGTTAEEIVGKFDADFYNKEILHSQRESDRKVIATLEDIFIPEEELIDAKGKVHLVQTFKRAIDNQDGNEKLVLSVGSDITELKVTEKALRESEQKLRTLLRAIPDVVLRYQMNGTILDYHAPQRDTLFKKENVKTENLFKIIDKELSEKILLFSEKAVRSGEMQVFEHKGFSNGSVAYWEMRIINLPTDAKENLTAYLTEELIIIIKDISQFKIAQAELMKYLAEIKSSKNVLEQKTIELSHLNQKLNESEQELKALNASKDKFFSIIAHDLRSPFTSLLGLSEMFASDYEKMTVAELEDISGKLLKSAKLTFILLENLLQWARIRTGRIKFKPEPFLLRITISQMIDLYKPNAESKNITIISKLESDAKVFADMNMTETILRNIISNSIKFTDKGGKISISSSQENDYAVIKVSDNGIGMNQKMQDKLFQIDQNVTRLGTQYEEGSGFGLILSKEFVEMNGGQISVVSAQDKGTSITFTLPLSREIQ